MACSYQEICQGEEPWIALGNFVNAWYGDAKNQRLALVIDPPVIPEQNTPELQKWAAFIAASAEWFCQEYALACPAWTSNPVYSLTEPWLYALGVDREEGRQQLVKETPEPFTCRNIYCGKNMYANKYELEGLTAQIRDIRARKNRQREAS